MRPARWVAGWAPALSFLLALAGCGAYRKLTAPATPVVARPPRVGEIPDAALLRVIREADLIVLGTPVDRVSEAGVFMPAMQLGAKETWYSVKLVVDSVAKGKLGRAKRVDLGGVPLTLVSDRRFEPLGPNEIVVQYPEVEARSSTWADAPPLDLDQRAVFLFKRCYYCVELKGLPQGRGPYYKANPLVAMTWASKLPPEEWPRVVRLIHQLARLHGPPS